MYIPYLTICAIARNEALYLEEWLKFHRLQGVEHFFIYDNGSTDETQKILKNKNDVTVIPWLNFPGQNKAYNHHLKEHHVEGSPEWCAFIDIDEFLFSPTNKPLMEVLVDYDDFFISGVVARWALFGSNNELYYTSHPVVERFTKRAKEINPHCKSIMKMDSTLCTNNDPHSFKAVHAVVNENKEPMPEDYAVMANQTMEILRINHYVTKSKEEYYIRKQLPDANSGVLKDIDLMWNSHDVNEVEDFTILENIKALSFY